MMDFSISFRCPDDCSRMSSSQPDSVIGCVFLVRQKSTSDPRFLSRLGIAKSPDDDVWRFGAPMIVPGCYQVSQIT